MTSETTPPPLKLTFPCEFMFKAFGPGDSVEFPRAVHQAAVTVMQVPLDAVKVRMSGQGRYQAVSVVVLAHNLDQIQAIYQALKTVPDLQYLL